MDPEDLVASSVNDPDKDDDKSESITVEKDNPPAGRQREIVLKPLSVKLHQLSSAQVEDLKESLRQSGYRDIRKSSVEKDLTDEGSDSQSEGSDSEKNRKRKCELTDEGIPVKKSRPEEGGKAVKPTKQDDALRQSSYSSSKTKETGSKTLTAPKRDDLRDKTPSKTEKTDIKKYKPAKILEKGQKRPINRPTTSGEGIGRSASASWDDLEKRLMFFMKMEAVQRKHDVGSDQSNESSLGKIKKKSESDRLIFQSPIMSAPQPEEDRERSWSSGYDNRQSSEKRGGHRGRFKRRGHDGNRGDRNRQQERRRSDQKERSRSLSSSRTPQDDGEGFDYGVGADDSDDNGIESSSGKLGDSSAEDILTQESSGALFQDNILDILEQLQPVSTDYSQHGGDDGGNEPAPKKMKMDKDNSMTDSCDLCGVQYSGEQRRQEHIDGNLHGRHFVLMLENLGKEMFADRYPDVVPGKAGEELLKKRQDSTSVAEDYDPGEDIEELNAIGVKSNQSVVGNLGEVGRKLLTAWRTTSELNLTDEEKDELLINLVKLIRVQPTLGVSNIRMAVTGFAESNDIKQVAKPAEQQEPAVIDFEFAFSCLLTDIMNSASFTSDKQKIKGLAKVHFDKMANKSLDSLAPYMKTSMMLRIKGKEDKVSASAQFDINLRIAKLLISLNVSMDEKDSMFTYLKKRMEEKLNPTELKALAEKELQELKFTSEIQSGSAKEQIEKLQEAWGIIDEIIVISDDKDKFMVHVLKKLGETPKLDITALLKQAAAEFGMNHNSREEETAPCTTFDFIFMCLFTGMDVNREEKDRIRGLAKSHYEKDPDMPLERFVSYVKTSTLLKKKGKEEKERVSKQFDWNLKITRLLIDLQVDVQRKDEMYKFLMDGMVRGVHPDKLRTSAEQRLQESRADQSPQFGVGRSISRDEQDSSVQSSKPAATRKDSVSRSSNNGKVKSPDSNVPVKEADGTSVSRDQIQFAKPTDTETSKTSNGREGQKPLDVKDSQPLAQKQTDVNTRPNLKAMDQETKDINRTPVSGSVPQKQPDAKTTPVSKPAQQKVTDVKTPPVSKPTQQKITDVKVSPVSKPVQRKPVDVKTTPVSKPTQQKIADVKATPPSKPIQCNTTDAKTTPVLKQTPPKATGAKPSVSKSTDAKTTPGSKSTPQKQGEVQATPVLESTQQKPTVIPKPPQQKPAGTKSTPQKAADSNTPVSKQTPQKSIVVTSTSVSETKQEKITDTKTTAVSVAAQQKATSIKIIPVSKTTPQKSADVKTTPVSKPVPQKPTDAKTKPLSKPIQKQEEAKTGSKPPQENPTSIKLTTASESLPQKLADAKTTPISKPTDAKTPPVSKLAQQKLTEVQTTQISKSAQQKPTDIKAEPVPKPAQQKAVSIKIAVPQQKAASVKIISPKAASVKIVAPQQKAAGAQTASNSKSNQQKTIDSKSRKSFEMNFEYIFICLLSDVVIDQKERERIEKLSKAQYNKTPKGMPLEQFCSYVKTSTLFKKAKDEKERLSAQFDLNLKITKLLIELKVGLNLKDKMHSFLKENFQKKTRPDQLKSQAVKYLKELTTISEKQAVQSSKSSDSHDEQHPDLSAKCVQVKQSEEKKKEITKSVSTGNIPPWKQENQSSTKNSSGAEKKLPTAEHTEKLQAALKAACTIMNEIKAKKNDADHTKAHPQAKKSEVTEKSPVKKSQTGTSDATKSHEVTEKSPVKKSQTESSDVNKKSDVEWTQMESVEKPHLDWREFDYIISSLFTDINLSDEVKEQIRKLAEPVFEKNKLSLAVFYSYVKASTLLRKKVQKEKEQAGEQFDLNLKITRLLMRNRVEAEYREEMYRFFKDSVQKGISQKKIKPGARKHMLILKGEQSEVTQGNADTEKVDQGSSGDGTDSSEGEKKALTTKQQQKPQQQITKKNSTGKESTVKSLMKQKMKTNTTQQNSGQKGRFSQYASGVRRPPPSGMQRTSGSIQNPFSNILNPSGSRQNPSHSMLRPSGGTLSLSGAIRNPSDGLHAFGTHSSRIQEFRGFSVRQPGASVSLYDSDLRKPDVDFRIRQEATLSGDWQGGFMQNQQHERELLSRGLLDSFYPEEQEPRRAWPGPGYGMQSHQYQRY